MSGVIGTGETVVRALATAGSAASAGVRPLHPQMAPEAVDQAIRVLQGNGRSFLDLDGAPRVLADVLDPAELTRGRMRELTVPSGGQYPHQWNWDSALIALGHGSVDVRRGVAELDSLLGAQLPDGRVPHIAFSPGQHEYLPGPEWWGMQQGGDGRYVTGLSNPPLAGMAANRLLDLGGDEVAIREMVPKIQKWHDWYLTDRTPAGLDEPVSIHPWEGGRDNAIEWDEALDRAPTVQQAYVRKDTNHVDPSERPPKEFYDKVLGLVENGTNVGWDQRRLATDGPYRVLDAGLNGLLAADAHELSQLAGRLGMDDIARRAAANHDRVAGSLNSRMTADGSIHSVDLAHPDGPTELPHVTAGIPLAVSAPGIDPRAVERARQLVTDGELADALGVVSTSAREPKHEARNYWRGPVWGNTAWLAAEGFARHGDDATAALLRERLASFAASTTKEYADARTGFGIGADDFSWNEALALYEHRMALRQLQV